jgi:hypothetical protein
MLTNERLTSIAQGSSVTSAEPPNISGGWRNIKIFLSHRGHAGCTGAGDCYPRLPYLPVLEMWPYVDCVVRNRQVWA